MHLFIGGQWPGEHEARRGHRKDSSGCTPLSPSFIHLFTNSHSGLSLESQASTKEPTTAANRTQSQCEAHVASHRTWDILHNQTRDANKTFGNHKCTCRALACGCHSQKAAPLSTSDLLISHCSQLCPLPVWETEAGDVSKASGRERGRGIWNQMSRPDTD